MSKIGRGPRFLRTLWLCFVITMTALLASAVVLLIKDFLNYDVSVHTETLFDAPSEFPAITVCHHHPFSERAYKLWNTKKVLSPTQFNQYMRNLTYSLLVKNDLENAIVYNYDSLNMYYQNLKYEEVIQLGHPYSIFLNCMRNTKDLNSDFENDCAQLEGYKMRRFSHHQFFNCHTFEPSSVKEMEDTTFFSLIVSLGPNPDYAVNEQAFLVDIFEQAKGLRVVVHEPGTYPDMEKEGLHVEPGKLNEINYQHVKWNHLNTPPKPCLPINSSHDYWDLDKTYKYEQMMCVLQHQQQEIMDECKCMYIMNPRPRIPTDEMPYCGRVMPTYNTTKAYNLVECIQSRLSIERKRKYIRNKCFPSCSYSKYESTISITKWRVREWQLHWLRLQSQAHRNLTTAIKKNKNLNITSLKSFHRWMEYLTNTNLTNVNKTKNSVNFEGDNFAYVVLKRKTATTIAKSEKLVLSLNVLLSRIGGLCSLTIGLTAAFAVELVEFFYVYIDSRRNYSNAGSARGNSDKAVKGMGKGLQRRLSTSEDVPGEAGSLVAMEIRDISSNRNGGGVLSSTENMNLLNSPAFSQMVPITTSTREHFL